MCFPVLLPGATALPNHFSFCPRGHAPGAPCHCKYTSLMVELLFLYCVRSAKVFIYQDLKGESESNLNTDVVTDLLVAPATAWLRKAWGESWLPIPSEKPVREGLNSRRMSAGHTHRDDENKHTHTHMIHITVHALYSGGPQTTARGLDTARLHIWPGPPKKPQRLFEFRGGEKKKKRHPPPPPPPHTHTSFTAHEFAGMI